MPPLTGRGVFGARDIDAVLFDMDGTLIDSDNTDVASWARRVARVVRAPEEALTIGRVFVLGLETPFNALFTLLDKVGLDTTAMRLLIALQGGRDRLQQIPPIAGTAEMIHRLAKRFKLGIVSSRRIAEERTLLEGYGLLSDFKVLVGRDTTWRIKPHPAPVLFAARALGVDPRRCLMVGDTTVDMLAGKSAGTYTAAVLCGYGQRAELERAGADVILDSTVDIEKLLMP